jgi:glycosyltransferase involved in cell wall biosynthesis
MACGVPVIASRVGGLPEVVVHGETGALAPVGAVDTMASAALQLLCDPARAQAAREACVRRAALFTADRIVPQYEALYQRVLDN